MSESGPDGERPALGQVMAGCTVLVTADRRKSELAAALQRRGAEVRHELDPELPGRTPTTSSSSRGRVTSSSDRRTSSS